MDRIEKFRTYEIVVERLQRLISTKQLQPGHRLPTERVLAGMLGTSRTTVREACRVLEHMGIISSRVGSGRYVMKPIAPLGFSLEPNHAKGHTIAEHDHLRELLEARQIIEIPMAELAAQNASPQDIEKMKRILSAPTAEVDQSIAVDMTFHSALAAACGNSILQRTVESQLFSMYREMALTKLIPTPDRWRRSANQHWRLVAAIATRDPLEARAAMEEHLKYAWQDLAEIVRYQRVGVLGVTGPGTAGSIGGLIGKDSS